MEKGKNRLQASYHIDCKFLVQNWFILKNVIRLLSVRTRNCSSDTLQEFFKEFAKNLKPEIKKLSSSNISEVAACRRSAK